MARQLISCSLFTAALLLASASIADDAAATLSQDTDRAAAIKQNQNTWEMRRAAAVQEYDARMAEFQAGQLPANVAIQANTRLLHASLVLGVPDAAVDYDRRASRIESIAKKNLELRTGTNQDVAQAESARLNALLKAYLERAAD
ncbi:MAG TPA: hypothetical protein DDX19_06745 [Rhodopirellula baltica]|uniref:Uncharacterized protein n=1 Tax=Rhodopirellula baltica (strain DSM 10527 / NCIMB 13988 / SH1) TaxID=243090 RepID=Q7UW02_RHOBA|nr:hypothetical protein [Rhodopirellula baltica]CAD72569.1 hypothetical protein-signal peptide and transmembrane prediction [Rhodopirellula baltica SH 1]HBE62432.1 hypothetical protein [Rhodopirellula baltica]